jgi:lipid II:glycine glycyltransferase (peptidoglycan interpeptide bridge formation enzyme)
VEGTNDELYDTFLEQMAEMLSRKGFVPRVNYKQYRTIQAQLPDHLKMKIMVALQDGKSVCSIVVSALGDTGIFLFGASGNEGLRSYASHMLHWRVICWLKQCNHKRYDLGGIDPKENPGTYQFKRGLAGRLGEDRFRMNQFIFGSGLINRVFIGLVKLATMHRRWAAFVRALIAKRLSWLLAKI